VHSEGRKKLTGAMGACIMAAASLVPTAAIAADVTLRAVSGFTSGSAISRTFDEFVNKVNSDPDAPVQFKMMGGPEAMPPFQLGNAVRTGVVDVILAPGAFYSSLMPEAEALKLSMYSPQELRASGAWKYIENLWREKLNVHYLANTNYGNRFHLYLNKRLASPDLSRLKIRVTPVYRDFFSSLGATVMQTPPGEVYTALERGVVDGYGWPMEGIFDLGWHEQTKFRVDPGFYTVEVGVLFNHNKWQSLTEAQRAYLTEMAAWLEERNSSNAAVNESERKRQAEAGIETIAFTGEQARHWIEQAYQAGWESIIKQSPKHGPKLKELLSR
jgi:TRAP-type C4-dicarboxylate transport system substrate-binding protein